MSDITIEPGLYRHYKGGRYRVLGTGTHSETGETMVIYQALYGQIGWWVRPASMFAQLVDIDGKLVPRFSRD